MIRVHRLRTNFIADTFLGEDATREGELRGLNKTALEEKVLKMRSRDPDFEQFSQQEAKTILEREFKINTTTGTIGSLLSETFYPAYTLFSTALSFKRIAGLYQFMRWSSVRLRVVMRTLPQQYGFVSYLKAPMMCDNIGMFRAKDPVVMSLNQQDAVEIDLPWVWPNDWMQVSTAATELLFTWIIHIHSLSTETDRVDSTVSNTYSIETYASFKDVQFAGPKFYAAPALVPEVSGQMADLPLHQADLPGERRFNRATLGAAATMFGATIPTLNAAKSWMWPADEKTLRIKGPAGQKGVTLSTYGATATSATDDEGENLDLFPDDSFVNPNRYTDPVMRHKILDLIKNPQYLRTYRLIEAGGFTLPIHPCSWPSDANIEDIGYLAYFCQYFRRWRGSLRLFVKITTSSFVSARVQMAVDFGGALTFTQLVGDLPSEVITIKGDYERCWVIPFYRRTNWANPCISSESTPEKIPSLKLGIESIACSGDRAPAIMVQVWLAAGDDFVFDSYQRAEQPLLVSNRKGKERKDTRSPKKRKEVEGQCDIRAAMNKSEPLPGFKLPPKEEWTLTVEDLLSRWSERSNIDSSGFQERVIVSEPEVSFANWETLNWLFLFNTGSIRYKIQTLQVAGVLSTVLECADSSGKIQTERVEAGKAITDVAKWPVLDVCVPFIANNDVQINPNANGALFTYVGEEYRGYFPTSDVEVDLQWVKAGHNYQVILPIPPPERAVWPWANAV